MEQKPLTIEFQFAAPDSKVWKAISEKDQLQKWFFDIPAFQAEVGFKFQFEGGESHQRYMHLCEVQEVIIGTKLQFSWQYKEFPGLSIVTLELSPSLEKTTLKLSHEGIETFEGDDFSKEKFMGGWTFLLNESLRQYLENGKALRDW